MVQRPASDVLSDYGDLLQQPYYFDTSWLPAPKGELKGLLKDAWQHNRSHDALRGHIETSFVALATFQPVVGPIPMPHALPTIRSALTSQGFLKLIELHASVCKMVSDESAALLSEFLE